MIMTNFTTPEQFAAANKANVETAMSLVKSAVARAERISALNLNTVRSVLEDSTASAKTLTAVKNPQELMDLQATLTQPIVEKAVDYARSVNEIVAEGQQEVAKLFEAKIAEMNKSFTAALDQAAKSAPAGTEAAFAALKSAVAAGNSAYENVSNTVKQMAETAEGNLTAAAEAAVKAVTGNKAK
jgi:phasin family protein